MTTIEELYQEILDENQALGENWINPRMLPSAGKNDDFKNNYFRVEVDDFECINATTNVIFFSVLKKSKVSIIGCRRRFPL